MTDAINLIVLGVICPLLALVVGLGWGYALGVRDRGAADDYDEAAEVQYK